MDEDTNRGTQGALENADVDGQKNSSIAVIFTPSPSCLFEGYLVVSFVNCMYQLLYISRDVC
jgi:hypothetical protein